MRLYAKPSNYWMKLKIIFTFVAKIFKGNDVMEATMMKRPETIALTYDKSNPMAKKTLDFFLSLGIFKIAQNQVEIGLEEYRQGKYTVINKGKSKVSNG